jgi:hypothetical protein
MVGRKEISGRVIEVFAQISVPAKYIYHYLNNAHSTFRETVTSDLSRVIQLVYEVNYVSRGQARHEANNLDSVEVACKVVHENCVLDVQIIYMLLHTAAGFCSVEGVRGMVVQCLAPDPDHARASCESGP